MTDATTPALADEIHAYYALGKEDGRLRGGVGLLEFLRTRDVLRRLLPSAPARVLDAGGGSGVHAEWLARDGYAVELLDPVPLHVEQASALPGVRARLGDARHLDFPDGSFDAVLLLGPLYHLPERTDRLRALAEARRVARPGAPVVAATINRLAALHDTLRTGGYFAPGKREFVDRVSTGDGLHEAAGFGFTTAYFHRPEQIAGEFTEAGLAVSGQYGLEGAAWLMDGLPGWLEDPERREAVLGALRLAESEPSVLGVSGHLLTAARR